MAKLSLVERAMVDLYGVRVREEQDRAQLGITEADMDEVARTGSAPEGFEDLGLVEYNGVEYYASIFRRPIENVEDEE